MTATVATVGMMAAVLATGIGANRSGAGRKAGDGELKTYGLQLIGRQAFPTCRWPMSDLRKAMPACLQLPGQSG
jgi:hypothetical protein